MISTYYCLQIMANKSGSFKLWIYVALFREFSKFTPGNFDSFLDRVKLLLIQRQGNFHKNLMINFNILNPQNPMDKRFSITMRIGLSCVSSMMQFLHLWLCQSTYKRYITKFFVSITNDLFQLPRKNLFCITFKNYLVFYTILIVVPTN